ncbi:MAG: anti-sigma factor antagonist [Bacteroidales bacterium]|nr:anti-sigma factor antagonist [Bacteroidales bacterium]
MNFDYRLNNGVLTISLDGRLDTEAATSFEAELVEICKNNPHESLIFDAEKLQYVASSGLRTMLKMAKTEKNFSIENVSDEVYSVFEMTGFSRIMTIRKALRKIDLEKCEKIGAGGNGAVYRVSEDEIVKVNYDPDTYEGLDKELAKAKEAFLLGIPTAISFDLVDCGDGKRGVVYETIKSRTLGETIQSCPERMEELTDRYIEQLNILHAVHTDNHVFGSAKDNYKKQVESASKYLSEEEGKMLQQILEVLPEGDRLVHCDAHPKNIMIQNGDMLWIDMEGMAVGHPIYDLISISAVLNGVRTDEITMGICGMDIATVLKFKECFIRKYFKTEDEEMIKKYSSLIDVLRLIRAIFAIGFTSKNTAEFRPGIIEMARKVFFPNIQNIIGGLRFLINSDN